MSEGRSTLASGGRGSQGAGGRGSLGGKPSKGEKMGRIQSHEELDVYRLAFDAAMRIFELTKGFPKEETYSLTDQMRRSSRSVCSNIAESWRRRRYKAAFVNKLNEAESEAAETQTWIKFAVDCGYLDSEIRSDLHKSYDFVIGKLVNMIINPAPWIIHGESS